MGDLWTDPAQPNATDNDEYRFFVYHTHIMTDRATPVKVQNTHNIARVATTLVDLMSFLASPRRDDVLLAEAGVSIDRALFPLLIRLASANALSVAELADQVGRDHSTISRQLAKLESMDLIERIDASDRRRRSMRLTAKGATIASAIGDARMRLLSLALADWKAGDLESLAHLTERFAGALDQLAHR